MKIIIKAKTVTFYAEITPFALHSLYQEERGKMYGIKSSMEIGKRMKRRRKELGISQEKLAERLDVTYQQIQRYENGTNQLNTEKLQIIAAVLDIPVSYFFEDEKDRVAEPPAQYVSEEEKILLKYFRRISKSGYKNLILTLLKLACDKK